MAFFDPENFIAELKVKLRGECKVEKRSKGIESLKYKLIESPRNFAFLFFELVDEKVTVVFEFSSFAEDSFISSITNAIESLIKSQGV